MKQKNGVIRSKIYGISKHQEAIDDLNNGDELVLKREPNNSYDKNAIQIHSKSGKILGYVKAEIAADLAKQIDKNFSVRCRVLMITGQAYKNKGVNIEYVCAAFDSANDQFQGVM